MRAPEDGELANLLDRAQQELQLSLGKCASWRASPAVLTERGLERHRPPSSPPPQVPVTVEARGAVAEPVESAASSSRRLQHSEAHATHATVTLERFNGHVTIEVADDGVGGANSWGCAGWTTLAALDGTLWLESPAGHGTRPREDPGGWPIHTAPASTSISA